MRESNPLFKFTKLAHHHLCLSGVKFRPSVSFVDMMGVEPTTTTVMAAALPLSLHTSNIRHTVSSKGSRPREIPSCKNLNWSRWKESNLLPMRVTTFTALRSPLKHHLDIKLVVDEGLEPPKAVRPWRLQRRAIATMRTHQKESLRT